MGARRPDWVAITAAMLHPTGLAPFKAAYPDRVYDVGIAEQHAMTSAAGLAMGGLHPVAAIYATFLNRAFDQVLLDVAMHRLPVTFVLDRAGVTGDDGPSHNGMWDLSILTVVPGIRIAGLGTNLACFGGVVPGEDNMNRLVAGGAAAADTCPGRGVCSGGGHTPAPRRGRRCTGPPPPRQRCRRSIRPA